MTETIYQATLNDGTVLTWYLYEGATIFLNEIEFITDLREYEKKKTIATHKDHNPFIDLIEL